VLAKDKEVILSVCVGIQNKEDSRPVLSDKPQVMTTTGASSPFYL